MCNMRHSVPPVQYIKRIVMAGGYPVVVVPVVVVQWFIGLQQENTNLTKGRIFSTTLKL